MNKSSRPIIPAAASSAVETLYTGQWLSLRKRGHWEYVERNHAKGAVIILAVTPEERILFVEQYRVSILRRTIEMPAGLIGDLDDQADESALVAARRELEEETGYRCEHLQLLHQGPSSSGMSTEMICFVRASGLTRVGPGGGVDSEAIIVHEVPRQEVTHWLLARAAEGYSVDPKLFTGLWFLEHEDDICFP